MRLRELVAIVNEDRCPKCRYKGWRWRKIRVYKPPKKGNIDMDINCRRCHSHLYEVEIDRYVPYTNNGKFNSEIIVSRFDRVFHA